MRMGVAMAVSVLRSMFLAVLSEPSENIIRTGCKQAMRYQPPRSELHPLKRPDPDAQRPERRNRPDRQAAADGQGDLLAEGGVGEFEHAVLSEVAAGEEEMAGQRQGRHDQEDEH